MRVPASIPKTVRSIVSSWGDQIAGLLQGNTHLGVLLLIWGTATLSRVIPNIPLVISFRIFLRYGLPVSS